MQDLSDYDVLIVGKLPKGDECNKGKEYVKNWVKEHIVLVVSGMQSYPHSSPLGNFPNTPCLC
jgi:hypothetical protein